MPEEHGGRRVPAGYASGPGAPARATARALAKAPSAGTIVLVEGISDQIAVETLAVRRGRDLEAEGVVVLPTGGAHAATRYLHRFAGGPRLAGLCDAAEEGILRAGLAAAGVGTASSRTAMARLGFHVCVEDLEDELIRAVGPAGVESLFAASGDLAPFRTLQRQPEWRGRAVAAQMRRFLGSGARRKLRYAHLLVTALDPGRVPRPLDALLAGV